MTSSVMNVNESAHQKKFKFTNFCINMFKVGCFCNYAKMLTYRLGRQTLYLILLCTFNGITE